MKEFWVGQKVRLIAANNPECVHKVGDVGVITALAGHPADPMLAVAFQMFGLQWYTCDFPNGPLYAPASDLAPVYDGDQPSTWDEGVWKPETEEVGA